MSKAFRIKYLFTKYLNNTCNEDQLEELFNLLADENDQSILEDYLKEIWEKTPADKVDGFTKNESANLYERFQKLIPEKQTSLGFLKRNYMISKWVAAACLFLCISIGFYWLLKPAAHSKTMAFQPTRKNRQTILLPDGSTVILNKNSKLGYPEKFSGNQREVYLTGEGYFDIKHDSKKPFLVHTKQITTRVLGTAFNIKAYHDQKTVEVTVTRGRVAVSDHEKLIGILLPNQQIVYTENTGISHKEHLNSKNIILWKEDDLVLENITIEHAIALISQRYGIPISLASDKIKNCRFTASFLNTTKLDQVLTIITHLNGLDYKATPDGAIILSGDGCE